MSNPLEAAVVKMSETLPWWSRPSVGVIDIASGKIIYASSPSEAASLSACGQSLLEIAGPGDLAITNDPRYGSPHITVFNMLRRAADVAVIVRASVQDVGGFEIGGFSPKSFDIWGEGVRFTPIRYRVKDGYPRHVGQLLEMNTRTPRTQKQTLQVMAGYCDSIDPTKLTKYSILEERQSQLLEATNSLEGLKPGRYAATTSIPPGYGTAVEVTIRLEAKIETDFIDLDFSATDRSLEGSLNSPLAVTVDSCLAALASSVPGFPAEVGALDSFKVTATEGSLLNAVPPSSTALCRYVTYDHVAKVVAAAITQAGGKQYDEESTLVRTRRNELHSMMSLESGRMRGDVMSEIQAFEEKLQLANKLP